MPTVTIQLQKLIMPLRILEILLGLIVLALMADFAHYLRKLFSANLTGSGAFLLFCGLWGFLLGIALLVVYLQNKDGMDTNTGYVVAILDVVTTVFYFAGFIAAANDASDLGNCDNYPTIDGTYPIHACKAFKAGVAMGAFAWVAWLISALISVPPVVSSISSSSGGSGGGNAAPPPAAA